MGYQMSSYLLSDAEMGEIGITSASDPLKGTSAQNRARFDELPKAVMGAVQEMASAFDALTSQQNAEKNLVVGKAGGLEVSGRQAAQIGELNQRVQVLEDTQDSYINDQESSQKSVYSSQKTEQLIASGMDSVKTALIDDAVPSAGTVYSSEKVTRMLEEGKLPDEVAVSLNGLEQRLAQMQSRISELEYQPLEFRSVSVSPEVSELGSPAPVTVFWELAGTPSAMQVNGTAVDASAGTYLLGSLNETSTILLTAEDSKTRLEKTVTAGFYPAVYYGGGDGNYTESWVKGLSKVIQPRRNGTYSVTVQSGERLCLVLPVSYGTPDVTVGGFSYPAEMVKSLSVKNQFEVTADYQVWAVGQPLSAGTVKVVVA